MLACEKEPYKIKIFKEHFSLVSSSKIIIDKDAQPYQNEMINTL